MTQRTMERIDPLQQTDILGSYALHLERYEFALQHLHGQRVLDIACGNGYGSAFIKTQRPECRVLGVDVAEAAIAFARQHYVQDRLDYQCSEAATFSTDEVFDTVISLETLEHLPAPELFVQRIRQLMVEGGKFIVSVPITYSTDVNPYHLHDFTERQLVALLAQNGFQLIAQQEQIQVFNPFNLFSKERKAVFEFRQHLLWYYVTHPFSAIKRLMTTLRYGFKNVYLLAVFIKI
jgi:2-polyprenyl-3-methyl-5-hydroxy-6-metoxy-1,4-benzoquinol methylase